MNRFKCKYISASSICYSNLEDVPEERYDLIISAANWDQRSTAITKLCKIQASLGIQIVFADKDNDGRQIINETKLAQWMESQCEGHTSIAHNNSNEFETLWCQITSTLGGYVNEVNGPLSVLVDLTVLPRYCSLGLLACCITMGLTEKITYFYAEGDYEDQGNNITEIFHKGSWKAIPIYGFEASYDPGKNKYYLVSVGFEGDSTMRVISTDDPDRVSILFPKPGFKKAYEVKTFDANKPLIDANAIPESHIINARAGDAIEAWRKLSDANIENPDMGNIFYLCCGTRPHSLGMALRAMTADFPVTVLYYMPDSYAVTNTKESGKYWMYEIRDMSVIPKILKK